MHLQIRLTLATAAIAAVLVGLFLLPSDSSARPSKKKKSSKSAYKPVLKYRIRAALEWLADHQQEDGSWSADEFAGSTQRKNAPQTHNLEFVKPGTPEGDRGKGDNRNIGPTSMAILAFLGSGYDHRTGIYKQTLRKALLHLRGTQGANGCFGRVGKGSPVTDHAVATQAIAEAYGLSEDSSLKPVVEKGVEFILAAQNDGAGWRYGIKDGQNDTQVTGWMVMALKSAKMAGFKADYDTAFEGASAWFDKVTGEKDGKFSTGYTGPSQGSPRTVGAQEWVDHPDMSAINFSCQILMRRKGWNSKHKTVKSQVSQCLKDLPKWKDKQVDFLYWYFATIGIYHVGGKNWERWEKAITKTLTANQRGWNKQDTDTFEAVLDEHGSWDSVGAWHGRGGRVWSTAAGCLTLQVVARYYRIKGK